MLLSSFKSIKHPACFNRASGRSRLAIDVSTTAKARQLLASMRSCLRCMCDDGVAASIHGDDATVDADVPVLSLSTDADIRRLELLLAPCYEVIDI